MHAHHVTDTHTHTLSTHTPLTQALLRAKDSELRTAREAAAAAAAHEVSAGQVAVLQAELQVCVCVCVCVCVYIFNCCVTSQCRPSGRGHRQSCRCVPALCVCVCVHVCMCACDFPFVIAHPVLYVIVLWAELPLLCFV